MKIENAINTFFETKEQYTAFISAWKSFIAEGKHAKYPVHGYDGNEYDKVSDLKCVHHLLYAALRGKDISKNFVPNNKTDSYHGPYAAYYDARSLIAHAVRSDYALKSIQQVFGDTVTRDMLTQVSEQLSKIKLGSN